MSVLRVGNACGFWGDSPEAPARLVAQAPDLDVLTLDYLAEVSMSILAKQRRRDPKAGFPADVLAVVRSLVPAWKSGRRLRVVTNGGGLNPRGCAEACAAILREAGVGLKIGVVSGDDVLARFTDATECDVLRHFETGESLGAVRGKLVTANAYLGAGGIAEAIRGGAELVITGRVADPSLTVGPCMAHFGWTPSDFPKIAGATIAGHLIECGQQVTGGISTHWLDVPGNADIGYPIVEVAEDGSCVVTKPAGTGGEVSERTVKEQLLYEIGDPEQYLSPDATVSFLGLKLADDGADRVRVSGAIGGAAPGSYKVSATYSAGYKAAGTLSVFGRDAIAKARRCGEVVREKLRRAGCEPREFLVECLGSGDVVPGVGRREDLMETVLRIAAADERREVLEAFARELMPLVTGGPQGTTGYADGRPAVREVFGYWPTVIPRDWVRPAVELMEV